MTPSSRGLTVAVLLCCAAGAAADQNSDQQALEDARKQWEQGRQDWLKARQQNQAADALIRQKQAAAAAAAFEQSKTGAGSQQKPYSCTLAQRQSGDIPFPSCCDQQMLGELRGLRDQAIPIVQNAISKLGNPGQVKDALMTHFKIAPNNASAIAGLKAQYNGMLTAMKAEDVMLVCRDRGDPACPKMRGGASENCSSMNPRHLLMCGDVAMWQSAQMKPVFTHALSPTSQPTTTGALKTLIHEYAHIGCAAGSGAIQAAGSESYRYLMADYPGATPTMNADSYAWFALEVK